MGQTKRVHALGSQRPTCSSAYGEKGSKERVTASGERPIGAPSFKSTQPPTQCSLSSVTSMTFSRFPSILRP